MADEYVNAQCRMTRLDVWAWRCHERCLLFVGCCPSAMPALRRDILGNTGSENDPVVMQNFFSKASDCIRTVTT